MKSLILSGLTLFFAMSLFADVTDKSTGITFPSNVSFEHDEKNYNLDLTGVATRKKLIIKVYSIAHYLEQNAQGSSPLDKILSDENAKQFTIKWIREVPQDKIASGYRESFENSIPNPNPEIKRNIDSYIAFFKNDAKKGDEHVIRWIPGGVIEVEINGEMAGTLTNPEFAKDLWNIWFGSNKVVKRDDLISNLSPS